MKCRTSVTPNSHYSTLSQMCSLVLQDFVSLSWAQAPGDEDAECTTEHSNPPVYSDTVRNLMDSYNYVNLLPGNGTGNSPIATAVWNDFSFDGNDITPETTSPTYVSVNLCFLDIILYLTKCVNTLVATRRWRNMSISVKCLWMEKRGNNSE